VVALPHGWLWIAEDRNPPISYSCLIPARRTRLLLPRHRLPTSASPTSQRTRP